MGNIIRCSFVRPMVRIWKYFISNFYIKQFFLQCNIFRHNKYNFCPVVCEVSTPYVKRHESYELEKNDRSNWTWTIKRYIYTQACFIIQVPFDLPFLLWSYVKLPLTYWIETYTHLDESYSHHVAKYNIDILHHT